MGRKHKEQKIYNEVEVLDAGSEGKAICRIDGQVIFVPFVVPGDVIDLQIRRKKKNFLEGKAIQVKHFSDKRTEAICSHFGLCGGCKWQNMQYMHQLHYKQKQVEDNLERIGKLELPDISPIIPSGEVFYYRNKLEFTFSNKKWLTDDAPSSDEANRMNALGFHLPGMFDRILDIKKCYLQSDPSNAIRVAARQYAMDQQLSFYDVRKHEGFLRNLIIRTSTTGEVMLIVVFHHEDEAIHGMLDHLQSGPHEITSLFYVINEKKNNDISDQEVIHYKGKDHIIEQMPPDVEDDDKLMFRIGPKSFYQTNSRQAYRLYKTAADFAELKGNETVYDLYTGTGTIANFVARDAKKVIGIEYVESAIEDARQNSEINRIENTVFYAGDMSKRLDEELIEKHGKPDVVITDPPRAGMHHKVVAKLLAIEAPKIVYVSCNPATQARDLNMLAEKYKIMKIQPVDMFPHTAHVENVVLLHTRK
ncbi:MAG: 23S rRNA (uracil(1939)-C(5))-methyltransferase RlmD [Bacteroidales bacterium]|nr:23S rRNA (uracil(1939)-C(5))-methyltransferase RlmD [Bacteroidales bacterium]MCF8344763.1 23S rRNA (uracil(1939)-C(5))-methyltransferase RlmD [Bacteroidales bacterium]MCF8352218.1 23S rRNA (uracil(1939)-C(5))-methyltransferase RlmD [Bacteroidales bacterium]MCF8375691.1 23S rRNA (uracil(1939)-C(5))-methyltransferase RlmD [Bacteroidales bacterium]MCF8400291.1 23S rRNA (uracil(1939)-C(5))-methyltransferase RlmD [Bacteroidales bacterium]